MLDLFGLKSTRSKALKIGDKFGRLSVLAVGVKNNRCYAICQCVCGSDKKAIRVDAIINKSILSCGCFQKEVATKHGLHKSPHYNRWRLMIDRCTNHNSKAYKNYGGRGINVCERWLSLKNFVQDLPDGYFEGAEIDRINNNGNYEPGNIRWVNCSQNADNRRSARKITFNSETKSLTEWVRETGLSSKIIWSRLVKLNWPVNKALTAPILLQNEVVAKALATRWDGHIAKSKIRKTDRKLRVVRFKDKNMTLPELSKETGVSVKLLYKRIFERGWEIEKAARI